MTDPLVAALPRAMAGALVAARHRRDNDDRPRDVSESWLIARMPGPAAIVEVTLPRVRPKPEPCCCGRC